MGLEPRHILRSHARGHQIRIDIVGRQQRKVAGGSGLAPGIGAVPEPGHLIPEVFMGVDEWGIGYENSQVIAD
jgi:hypothetical protein